MKFMLIAKATPQSEAGIPPDSKLIAALVKLKKEMGEIFVGSGGLLPSSAGAKVKLIGGNLTVIDGPFAETKELIAGYAIVELPSKEAAIETSKRFLQVHADILGPDFETESEIRQMFG